MAKRSRRKNQSPYAITGKSEVEARLEGTASKQLAMYEFYAEQNADNSAAETGDQQPK